MNSMKLLLISIVMWIAAGTTSGQTYTIVDTGQIRCYDNRTEITYPEAGAAFFGQDAQYNGNEPNYRANGDGTVTDVNTGLMWQADPGEKKTYAQAAAGAAQCRTSGYDDWRLPTIKELYSLILFCGTDPDPTSRNGSSRTPFIDGDFFQFQYGKASDGERIIDSQWATCTLYKGKVMRNAEAMFGVNFADGRIKGYPTTRGQGGGAKKFYVLYVRGNTNYGKNDFVDNEDGTITDRATGLTWMKADSAALEAGSQGDGKLNWQEALKWAEDLKYAGHHDWRLPNAKELHSIVDYARSPDVTHSAAIDPLFEATPIENEGGETDYAHYWSSTSHRRAHSAGAGVYIAFGRGLGFMARRGSPSGSKTLIDVHGAGAQRSDPKSGDLSALPEGRGPQGDVVRIYNLVRCVRGGVAEPRKKGPNVEMKNSPRRRPGADFVRRLDSNSDGKISRQEFDGPPDHFDRFDTNGDGYLSEDEAPGSPPPDRGRRIRRR